MPMIRVTRIALGNDDNRCEMVIDPHDWVFLANQMAEHSVRKSSATCKDSFVRGNLSEPTSGYVWLAEPIDEIWRRIEAAQGRAVGDESEPIWKTMLRSARLEQLRYRAQEFAADAAKKK